MFGIPKAVIIFLFSFFLFDLVLLSQDPAVKPLLQSIKQPKTTTSALPTPAVGFRKILSQTNTTPRILGEGSVSTPNPSPIQTTAPKKKSYKIAAIGDSMVETMGDKMDYLKAELVKKYPRTKFEMYNYGVGSEKVSTADDEFDIPFKHGDIYYPSLAELKPDVLIVGSFAYNPFDIYDRDGHWQKLADLVGKAKKVTPNVYILAEIAPSKTRFGQGPSGVNWPAEATAVHLAKIIEQMQNAIGLAKEMNVPLINVYDKSRDGDSLYGKEEYINVSDHIHPSEKGQKLTAKEIVATIKLDP